MAVLGPEDDPNVPPGSFQIPDGPSGGGSGYPGAPGGSPFIPTFGFQGGQAQPFQGFGGFTGYSPFGPRRRMAAPMTALGQPIPGSGGGRGGPPIGLPPGWASPGQGGSYFPGVTPGSIPGNQLPPWAHPPGGGPSQPPAAPGGGTPGQYNSVIDIINAIITHGVNGDMPGFGGAYSLNPPSAIMGGIRGQAIADAGAQQRAARTGLQSRGDADPSTYGFQSLMSDLQGQRNVAGTLSQADLALRQQQLQNYWNILSSQLQSHTGLRGAELGRPSDPSPWGSFLGGLGGVIGAGTKPWWV